MAQFNLSETADNSKVFLVKRSDIEDRLEPKFYSLKYYTNEKKIRSSKYPISYLFEVTTKISDGTHFTPNYKDDGYKFISVKDVRRSTITLTKTKFISEEDAIKLDRRCKPSYGDVLLTKIGATYGFAAMVETDEPFQIYVSLALLRPNNKLISKFLEIYLNTDLAYIQYERVIKGAGVPDLHLEDIRKIKIPLPPKDIQQQIVNLHQTAYNEKQQKEAHAKDLLASIDTYLLNELGITLPKKETCLQSRIFTTMFSEVSGGRFDTFYNLKYFNDVFKLIKNSKHKSVSLKSIISFIESGSRPTGGVSNIEDGILSLGGEHVNDKCEIEIRKPKYIPVEFHENILNTKTELHDILLVKDGATTGKVGIIENELHINQNINEHVFMIKVNENVNPHFLVYYLHAETAQIQIARGITGATVTGLTKDVVKNLQIPLPSIEKQTEIANHIQFIRTQAKQLQEEAKAVLEEAKREVEKMILG